MATTHFRPPTDSTENETPRITVTIGGDRLQSLTFSDILDGAINLGADVRGELAQIVSEVDSDSVHLIPIAEGETARTLAADANADVRSAIDRRAGTSTEYGLGQLRTDGSLGVRKLVQAAAFLTFFTDVIVPRMFQFGALSHLELVIKAGSSGATGSAGALVFAQALKMLLRERFGITVSITIEFTGGIVNAIHGANTALNAGACIVDALDFATNPDQDPHETRSVIFHELPALLERDTQARDRFMLQTEQARGAKQVRAIFNRMAPNRSLRGEFGGIGILRFDYHRQLHERRQVAADITRSLSDELHPVLHSPDLSLVSTLTIATEEQRVARESLESIVERAFVSDPEELEAAIRQPGISARGYAMAEMRDGQNLALANVRQHFAFPPQTGAEAAHRRSLFVETLHKLRRRRLELFDEVTDIQTELQYFLREIWSVLRNIHPQTMWQSFRANISSSASKERRLENAAAKYRDADDDLQRVSASLMAVVQAEQMLQAEFDFLQSKLGNMRACLERFQPRGQTVRSEPLVVSKSLNEMFVKLWRLASNDSDAKVLKVLCSAVKQVTLQGLAEITRAEFARVDHIARRIAQKKVEIVGPPWGGRNRPGEELCIHVLPPMASADAEVLKESIQKESPGATVAFADTASAGVNCIDIHVETVTQALDVLPAYYRNGAKLAAADDQRAVFYPDGLAGIKRLNLDTLLFPEDHSPAKGA
jgi:hypothetical protein